MEISGEQVKDATNCARRRRSVDSAKHEVAGLGRVDARLKCFTVAHFADQDHVGILPDDVLERRMPVRDVQADLTLIYQGLLIREKILDRVLDRKDVDALALVDVIKHRGDGGTFAAAGHPGQDNHSLIVVAKLLDSWRQTELLECGNAAGDPTSHEAETSALAEEVDPITAFVLSNHVSEVGATGL